MIAVTLQRQKCIGCNYCAEVCPELFRMSKKDGKTVLLKSVDKKGFFTVRVNDILQDSATVAVNVCPVKIIRVSEIAG